MKAIVRESATEADVFIGIDVHKKQWNVTALSRHVMLEQRHLRGDTSQVVVDWVKRHYPDNTVVCGYEAGFSGYVLQRAFAEASIDCLVVHSADIPTTHKQKLGKRDAVDSMKLAMAMRAEQIQGNYVPTVVQQGDRELVRERNHAAYELRRCKNRVKSKLMLYEVNTPEDIDDRYWSRSYKTWLRQVDLGTATANLAWSVMLDELDTRHQHLTKLNLLIRDLALEERFKDEMELVRSIPGIGLVTGITLLVEILPITRFTDAEHLASFLGLVPTEHSSGDTIHKGRLTPRKHKVLRSLLIEAAWMAIRKDPSLTKVYEKHRANKPATKAIVVAARKLCNSMHAVMTKREPYNRPPSPEAS